MRKLTKKEAEDLLEFFLQLDFEKVNDKEVKIVSNRFNFDDLPDFVRYQIELYLEALELIN